MIHIPDIHSGVELCDIETAEARIKSLVARNLHACGSLEENTRIAGSLRPIDGLAYHYMNYKKICVENAGYL
jgi:hypothetical protein